VYKRQPLSLEKLKEVVGGFEGKRIAYIPTAANGEHGWECWKHSGGMWEKVNNLGADVTLVVLENYGNNSVLKLLEGQDIIWFAGGMAGYLMYWLKRCGIDKELPKILKNKNIWLVGSSCGAMVMGKTLEIAEWPLTDAEIGGSDFKPLGLVDFDIFPHYEDRMFEEIKKDYQGEKLYLLKNGEEIIVRGEKVEMIGKERVVGKNVR
jgi:peptidase E